MSEPTDSDRGFGGGNGAPPAARREIDFAVVVGINDYPNFRSLRGAVNDARAFRDWLRDRHGGRLSRKNVELIVSKSGSPEQSKIDQALKRALDEAKRMGGRRLYFYFSGHGATNPDSTDNDVLLLLASWSVDFPGHALDIKKYCSALCSAGQFEEVALFLDCCLSPSVVRGAMPLFLMRRDRSPCETREFRAYATGMQHPAFEAPQAGVWHGLLTRCLLAILHEPSSDGVAADALKRRLERDVPRHADRRSWPQRAHVVNGLHEASRFGCCRRARPRQASREVELRFVRRRGEVTLCDAAFAIFARHRATATPWRLPLEPGLYRIEGGGEDPVEFVHHGWEASHDV